MTQKFVFGALVMLLVLSGCTTSTVKFTPLEGENRVSAESGREVLGMVEASNRGWFFLGCKYLPILSGKPANPNVKDYRMFTNLVKSGYLKETIDARVQRAGGSGYENLVIHTNSAWLPWIIFQRKDIIGEAIVVK